MGEGISESESADLWAMGGGICDVEDSTGCSEFCGAGGAVWVGCSEVYKESTEVKLVSGEDSDEGRGSGS